LLVVGLVLLLLLVQQRGNDLVVHLRLKLIRARYLLQAGSRMMVEGVLDHERLRENLVGK